MNFVETNANLCRSIECSNRHVDDMTSVQSALQQHRRIISIDVIEHVLQAFGLRQHLISRLISQACNGH